MALNSKQKKELKALARLPDETIDTSDIPEIGSGSRGVRGRFATRLISIRLSTADIDAATRIAAAKGLPYQTYIKSVLHEAFMREAKKA
jgi:uncharacterized protein (DUF4415 family)